MIVYLDSSVLLRKLQRQQGSLPAWGQWDEAYSSVLLRLEVLRTLDRGRLRGALTDQQVANLIRDAHAIFDTVNLVDLSLSILNRASQSFLTPLGTLDALHLSTALRVTENTGIRLVFVTHDIELALAARSLNFEVDGA